MCECFDFDEDLNTIEMDTNICAQTRKQNDETTQEPLLGHSGRKTRKGSITRSIQIISRRSSCEHHGNRAKRKDKMQPPNLCRNIMGDWGKWQLRAVLIIFLVKIPASWFMACIIFTAPAPKHGEFWCQPPQEFRFENATRKWIKISHPIKEVADQEFVIDFCNVYDDVKEHAANWANLSLSLTDPEQLSPRNASVVPCDRFEHHTHYTSLVTQFDLVCSRDILVAVTQFFHLLGILVGGIVATKLIEGYSPRKVMLSGMLAQIGCGVLTGTVTVFEIHMFFRFLSACCCSLMVTGGSVIFCDITGGKYTPAALALFEQFWSLGVIMLPGLASMFTSWSHLYMAISIPTIFLAILLKWVPDSPSWMIKKGYVLDAMWILEEAAKVNRREEHLPSDLEVQLQALCAEAKQADPPAKWRHIWRGPRGVATQIGLHVSWPIHVTCYYGTLLNIRSFGRDHLYINTALAGTCEILGVFICMFLILFTSEKKWVWASHLSIIGGTISCFSWFLPDTLSGNWEVAAWMAFAMPCKVVLSATLALLFACTSELVSPELRPMTGFSTVTWARFWLLCGPFIGVLSIFGVPASMTAFGALTAIGGVFTLLLKTPEPEKPVPELPSNKISALDPANAAVWTVPIDEDKTRL